MKLLMGGLIAIALAVMAIGTGPPSLDDNSTIAMRESPAAGVVDQLKLDVDGYMQPADAQLFARSDTGISPAAVAVRTHGGPSYSLSDYNAPYLHYKVDLRVVDLASQARRPFYIVDERSAG